MTAAGAHDPVYHRTWNTVWRTGSNTETGYQQSAGSKQEELIDFDAGPIVNGESIDDAAKRLLDLVIGTANGKETQTERRGYRSISIFKDGVVL